MTRKRKKSGAYERNFRPDPQQAAAVAQKLATQRATCEGCRFLQRWPRPQCKGERSAFYRMARDTYHDRCAAFDVMRAEVAPAEPQPISRFEVAGLATKGRRS